ncbi:MAG: hypothetical protein Q7U96_03080, partial [Chloroflexota bacterium]|nr:hypothetical protein [Chloroflexota bacterium]
VHRDLITIFLSELEKLPFNNEIGQTILMRQDAESVIKRLIDYIRRHSVQEETIGQWDEKSIEEISDLFASYGNLEVFKSEIYSYMQTEGICYNVDLGIFGDTGFYIVLERFMVKQNPLRVTMVSQVRLSLKSGKLSIDLQKLPIRNVHDRLELGDTAPAPVGLNNTIPSAIEEKNQDVQDIDPKIMVGILKGGVLKPGLKTITNATTFPAVANIFGGMFFFASASYLNRKRPVKGKERLYDEAFRYLDKRYGQHFERLVLVRDLSDVALLRHEILHDVVETIFLEEQRDVFEKLALFLERYAEQNEQFGLAYMGLSSNTNISGGLEEFIAGFFSGELREPQEATMDVIVQKDYWYLLGAMPNEAKALFSQLGLIWPAQEGKRVENGDIPQEETLVPPAAPQADSIEDFARIDEILTVGPAAETVDEFLATGSQFSQLAARRPDVLMHAIGVLGESMRQLSWGVSRLDITLRALRNRISDIDEILARQLGYPDVTTVEGIRVIMHMVLQRQNPGKGLFVKGNRIYDLLKAH